MPTTIMPPRGMFLGATLMYLLDPDRGHRRRAVIADKARKLRRKSVRAVTVAAHDLENRARGVLAQAGGVLEEGEVDDRRLEARVRARLGRVCSHPHAIDVFVEDGIATVTGVVLLDEWRRVRRTIKETRDLKGVDDRLEIHTVADIPRLMGGRPRVRSVAELAAGPWTPAARLVVGSLGVGTAVASAAMHGWRRRIVLGAGLTLAALAVGRELRARRQPGTGNVETIAEAMMSYDDLAEMTEEFDYIS